MKKIISWLGGLLVVQLLVIVGVYWNSNGTAQSEDTTLLTEVSPEAVDQIVIAESEKQSVLKKESGRWRLPNYEGLPARESEVKSLVERLVALKRHWPVANTTDTFKRFKVSDKVFERKVELKSGDKSLATLYFGTSPSFKKIHVRLAGESEAYAVDLNSYDLKFADKEWLEQSLLAYKDGVDKIKLSDLVLEKGNDWSMPGLADNESLDSSAADKLVTDLENLSVEQLLDKSRRESIAGREPEATLTLYSADKETVYSGYKDGDDYILVSSLPVSGAMLPFKISEYQYNKLFDIGRNTFVKTKESDKVADGQLSTEARSEPHPSQSPAGS